MTFAVVYILKSKKVVIVERDRMLPPIPKPEPAVQNPTYDVVDYEEPSSIQPVIYDTKKLERERRASVVLESPYHVESDGYLIITGEDPGVSSI